MQLCARRPIPGEIDHELVWLSVSASSVGLAAAWLAIGLPWPVCAFHELTGLPCVTCGMTRCAIQFFHGHFLAALKWNPLIFALLCSAIAFDVYALLVLVKRTPRLRIKFGQAEKKCARVIVVIALGLNWCYLLSHWRDF
jgi:hypothetical protein